MAPVALALSMSFGRLGTQHTLTLLQRQVRDGMYVVCMHEYTESATEAWHRHRRRKT